MQIHPSVTLDRLEEACRESMFGTESPGFCCACGADVYGVEPDADGYECDECGERAVYGAELLVMMAVW